MKRRYSLALIFALFPAGVAAVAACVGDEPAAVTPVYVERDAGQSDKDATPSGDAQPDQGTPWNPRKVDKLALWLDGADSNATKRTADNRVTEWTDKSGNNNHYTQPAVDRAPYFRTSAIADKAAIVFEASGSQVLVGPKFTGLGGAHAFLIFKVQALPNTDNGLWRFSPSDVTFFPHHVDGAFYDGFGSSQRKLAVPAPDVALPHLYEVVSTAKHWVGSFDGQPKADVSPNKVLFEDTGSMLGATNGNPDDAGASARWYFTGTIGELIIYGDELPRADIAAVRNYLATKWQISIAKPDGG